MKKLTAEKCRELISILKESEIRDILSIGGGYYLQALEISLPVLEQQEMITDNAPLITDKPDLITDTYRQIENDDWIEWGGGRQPISNDRELAVKLRDGEVISETRADCWFWSHEGDDADIIAYRVIENDGREG